MTRWLPVPILFCSCIVAYDYHVNPTARYYLALLFLPVTIGLTVVYLRHQASDLSPKLETVTWQPFTRAQVIAVIIGLVCLVMVVMIQRSNAPLLAVHFSHQFLLWMLGLGLITYGMAGGWSVKQVSEHLRGWVQDTDVRWLLAIILLGFVVRTIALHTAFPNYIDEGTFARAVVTLREQADVKIMSSMDFIAQFTWVFAYWQYLYTELFGANLGTLRVVSALIGTLTIPAVYLMGRWTFGRRIGLLTAFLLAIDLPHLHFSRLGLNNIADPLLGVLTIAFLWRGLQTGSRRSMALAGVCLGLTAYFYEGGRLLYPALMIGWLLIYALAQKLKVPKRGILVCLVTWLMITGVYYLSINTITFETLTPRLSARGMSSEFWDVFFTDGTLFQQAFRYNQDRIRPAYLHIMSQPDGSQFYYSRHLSIVLPHLLPFLLMGIGVAFSHWRRFGLILPLWILLTVLGNSLITDNNWTPRFVVLFPALVLIIALGLNLFYQSLMAWWEQYEQIQHRLQRLALVLLVMMGIFHISYYFRVMLPDNSHAYRQKMDDQDAAYRAQLLSSDTEVYIVHIVDVYHLDVGVLQDYEKHTIPVQIVAGDTLNYNRLDPIPEHPYAFFVDPKDTRTLTNLRRIFGDALNGPSWSPYPVPDIYQFALYQVDGEKSP